MFAPVVDVPHHQSAFLERLLETRVWMVPRGPLPEAANRSVAKLAEQLAMADPAALGTWLQHLANDGPHALPLDAARTLVAVALPDANLAPQWMLSVIAGPAELACRLVRNALGSWHMEQELASNRVALEESAMQLAQSFEEQNWLRGLARSATSMSRISSASEMASGILQPLGYLLRAQDVFLIVDPEEVQRSGLMDAQYGTSQYCIANIRQLMEEMHIGPASPPIVNNQLCVQTRVGTLHSLIAVAVRDAERYLGHLVAVNRGEMLDESHFSVCDPEFGSGDVGLLEEAAVLLATQAQNIHLLRRSKQLYLGTLHAMSRAIDARDSYTQGHSQRVARLSFDLAKLYGLSDDACQEIYLAGILHDIGKIGIPDQVLLKNGPLTPEEFAIIQRHPEIGYRIIEQLGHLQFVLPGVLHHHERWDGAGYPHGLRGTAIPLMARIMAVADAFDAMTSSRPYRSALPVSKAHAIIASGGGTQWDAQVVDCFQQWIAAQPTPAKLATPLAYSIIPQDSPLESMRQAVMAVGI